MRWLNDCSASAHAIQQKNARKICVRHLAKREYCFFLCAVNNEFFALNDAKQNVYKNDVDQCFKHSRWNIHECNAFFNSIYLRRWSSSCIFRSLQFVPAVNNRKWTMNAKCNFMKMCKRKLPLLILDWFSNCPKSTCACRKKSVRKSKINCNAWKVNKIFSKWSS